jgi:hypothetical protein
MAEFTGVKIVDLTASGTSDDGEHVWITHRLGDGGEYPLIYPYEAIGYLITVLTDAARSASGRRIARNPIEAEQGLDANIIPATQIRIGTSPDNSGAILHLTTADNVAIAVELPASILDSVIGELQRVSESLAGATVARRQLH